MVSRATLLVGALALGLSASARSQERNASGIRVFPPGNSRFTYKFAASSDGHEAGFSVTAMKPGSWFDIVKMEVRGVGPTGGIAQYNVHVGITPKAGDPLTTRQAQEDMERIFGIIKASYDLSPDMQKKVEAASSTKGLMNVWVVRDDPDVDMGAYYPGTNVIVIDIADVDKIKTQMTVPPMRGLTPDQTADAKTELQGTIVRSVIIHEWDHAAYGHPDPQGADAARDAGDAARDENQVLKEQGFKIERKWYAALYNGQPSIRYDVGVTGPNGSTVMVPVLLNAGALSDTKETAKSQAHFGTADEELWDRIPDRTPFRVGVLPGTMTSTPSAGPSTPSAAGSSPGGPWSARCRLSVSSGTLDRTVFSTATIDLPRTGGGPRAYQDWSLGCDTNSGGTFTAHATGQSIDAYDREPIRLNQPIRLALRVSDGMTSVDKPPDRGTQNTGTILSYTTEDTVISELDPLRRPFLSRLGGLLGLVGSGAPMPSSSRVARPRAPGHPAAPGLVIPGEPAQGGGSGEVRVFFVSTGDVAGDQSMRMIAVNDTGRSVVLVGDLVVLKPLERTAADIEREVRRAKGRRTEVMLPAYCLNKDLALPRANQAFVLAGIDEQRQFVAMRRIAQAARLLASEKGFIPDVGDTGQYVHAIRQWAIWTQEKRYTEQTFGDALVENVRKSATQGGQTWTRALEDTVRRLVPGRWRDIGRVLQRAGAIDLAFRTATAAGQ